ncbi:GNAT family N-acetyltransferase [uncultured Roseovarius sp.]|uniref:GNAT family N-acetyltransferase n=1 Tax=uncultured Roseovarius sp. TaxID=293344 RepID=UPI0026219353|nr:GNAT family N-acetyltransferase [uncultured Roseovarius sp.]
MTRISLRPFRADDAPWLVERHATLYAADEGFDRTFGPLVADIIRDFIASHDPAREAGWIAEHEGLRLGSIFCTQLDAETAKLRLFLLERQARGKGVGKRMLMQCMAFARSRGYRGMRLWTHESHRAACALYERTGWRLISARPVRSFGRDLVEQSWEITF